MNARMKSLAKVVSTAVLLAVAALPRVVAQATPHGLLYQATGDHERTYDFAAAGIESPYRLFVPSSWRADHKMPLVVILHGSNLNHDAAFDREPMELQGLLEREAYEHGFIVVAPEGYRGGSYGNTLPIPLSQYLHPGFANGPRGPHRPDRQMGEELLPAGPMPTGPPGHVGTALQSWTDQTAPELNRPNSFGPHLSPAEAARNNRLAEQDVLNVIRIVSQEYSTDPARLYLMGNSMGGIGTYYFAVTFPRMFTAIAPSDGPLDPTFYPYEKAKGIGGVMIVHGEDDPVAPIDDSEVMAFLFKKQGIDTVFVPVAKGGHGNSWYIALPKIFDFFDAHPARADRFVKP